MYVGALTHPTRDQSLAPCTQGLVNRGGANLFFNAGILDFDWPGADSYWVGVLTNRSGADAVTFSNISTHTLCGLVQGVMATPAGKVVAGAVM